MAIQALDYLEWPYTGQRARLGPSRKEMGRVSAASKAPVIGVMAMVTMGRVKALILEKGVDYRLHQPECPVFSGRYSLLTSLI